MATGTFSDSMVLDVIGKIVFKPREKDSALVVRGLKKIKDAKLGEVKASEREGIQSQQISSESELVARAQNGDKDAFRELFEQNYSRVYSAAMRIFGNASDASDLAQETFLKAYQNISSFKGTASFYTWVYRILFNASMDLKRKSSYKNEVNVAEDYVFDFDGSDPILASFHAHELLQDDKVYSMELRKIIGAALDELSPNHKQVIVAREVDGLSYEEISDLFDCSLGTVMSRLFHARKNLLAILNARLKSKRGAEDQPSRIVNF